MPVGPHTNEFMRRLPAALRPNPWNIEDEIMNLVGKAWSVSDIVAAVMADKPMQAGHVVAQLRRMKDQPAPAGAASEWKYGHGVCTMHDGCELCRCTRGSTIHHVAVPPPEAWVEGRVSVWGMGRID